MKITNASGAYLNDYPRQKDKTCQEMVAGRMDDVAIESSGREEEEEIFAQENSVSRKFSSSTVTLHEIKKYQEEILTPLRERIRHFQSKNTSRIHSSYRSNESRKESGKKIEARILSVTEQWMEDLEKLSLYKPDFFSNDEAIMKETGTVGKGRSAYASLPLSHLNCHDVRHLYEI